MLEQAKAKRDSLSAEGAASNFSPLLAVGLCRVLGFVFPPFPISLVGSCSGYGEKTGTVQAERACQLNAAGKGAQPPKVWQVPGARSSLRHRERRATWTSCTTPKSLSLGTAIAPEHFITDTSQAVIKESGDGKVTTVLAEGDYKEGG